MNWVGGWGRIPLGDNDSVNGIWTARYFSKDQITPDRYPGLIENKRDIKYLKSGENLISNSFINRPILLSIQKELVKIKSFIIMEKERELEYFKIHLQHMLIILMLVVDIKIFS